MATVPTYSVIIPAYNEEAFLSPTLAAVTAAMAGLPVAGELIVVDNNSTDRTAAIARSYGARVVFEKVNQISRARNAGARVAEGRYLIFVDADTLIDAGLLKTVMDCLQNRSCGGGGAAVAADGPLPSWFRMALHLWNQMSCRLRLAAGSFIFCEKEGFQAVGGFSENVYAGEEILFSLQYRRWCRKTGKTFQILTSRPVITSTRKIKWYSTPRLILFFLSMVFFPLVMHHRKLCGLWYRRPPTDHPTPPIEPQ